MADQYIVTFDDGMGMCFPMGPDTACAGAICAINSRVSMFSTKADARRAIRISTAWAKLQQTQGAPHNSDFVEGIKFVRIMPLVAWGGTNV